MFLLFVMDVSGNNLATISQIVLEDQHHSLEDFVSSARRILVMDTSAILHDPQFLLKTRPSDVVIIPEIVAHEIEVHKDRGTETTSFAAREYLRVRERLEQEGKATMMHLPHVGTRIMYQNHATVVEFPFSHIDQAEVISSTLSIDHENAKNDDMILQTAYYIQEVVRKRKQETVTQRRKRSGRAGKGADVIDLITRQRLSPDEQDVEEIIDEQIKVKLLTKDKGMLRRARDRGIEHAEYYRHDRISEREVSDLYTGHRVIEDTPEAVRVLEEYAHQEALFYQRLTDIPHLHFEIAKEELQKIGIRQLRQNAIYVAIMTRTIKGQDIVKELWLTRKKDGSAEQITLQDIIEIDHEMLRDALDTTPDADLKSPAQPLNLNDSILSTYSWEEGKLYRIATRTHGEIILRYHHGGFFDVIKKIPVSDLQKSTKLFSFHQRERKRFKKTPAVKRLYEERRVGFRFTIPPRFTGIIPAPNEFVVYKISRDSDEQQGIELPSQVILRYNSATKQLEEVPSKNYSMLHVAARNLEQLMAVNLLLDPEVPLVILGGKAGTGKTFLTLASGLTQLDYESQRAIHDKINSLKQGISALESRIAKLEGKIRANDYGTEVNYRHESHRRTLFKAIYGKEPLRGTRHDTTDLKLFFAALNFLSDRTEFGNFPETPAEFERTHQRDVGTYEHVKKHYDAMVTYFRRQIDRDIDEAKTNKDQKERELINYRSQETPKAKALYNQIIVTRPVIATGKDIGYIPGTVDDKMGTWLEGIKQNLEQLGEINGEALATYEGLKTRKLLSVVSIAHIRGSSYDRKLLIIDEAQNLTPHEVKTIVTRAGKGTKVVLIGDPEQIDSPYLDKRSCGMTYAAERFRQSDSYGHLAGYVQLTKGERSALATAASKIL